MTLLRNLISQKFSYRIYITTILHNPLIPLLTSHIISPTCLSNLLIVVIAWLISFAHRRIRAIRSTPIFPPERLEHPGQMCRETGNLTLQSGYIHGTIPREIALITPFNPRLKTAPLHLPALSPRTMRPTEWKIAARFQDVSLNRARFCCLPVRINARPRRNGINEPPLLNGRGWRCLRDANATARLRASLGILITCDFIWNFRARR